MEKEIINSEHLELVGAFKKSGIYKTEDGKEYPYKNYYIEIKNVKTGLIMRAQIDKVFRDYVENEEEEY